MKIYGFFHVFLINHWQDIVKDQINQVVNSGLYQATEKIYVGCLGKSEELGKLINLFSKHEKFQVVYYSPKAEEFEFATLKILKAKADNWNNELWHGMIGEKFYCYYFHTKAVSWNLIQPNGKNLELVQKHRRAFEGGTYWREMMNHYILHLWRENVKKLDEGFDTCGVKLLGKEDAPAFHVHHSGNYFWSTSDYIKKLPRIENLDWQNRGNAEMWIGKAEPKAATLCQEMADYNSRGKFKPQDTYGVNTPIDFQHTDQEKRFFKPQ